MCLPHYHQLHDPFMLLINWALTVRLFSRIFCPHLSLSFSPYIEKIMTQTTNKAKKENKKQKQDKTTYLPPTHTPTCNRPQPRTMSTTDRVTED